MATKEIGGSSSISDQRSNLALMKFALGEAVHYANELEKGVKMLIQIQGIDNEPLEKDFCNQIDENRAKFIDRFSRLTTLIAKQPYIDMETIRSIVKAIGSFKRAAKEHNERAMAKIERYKRQMERVDSVVDTMISELSNLAGGQVTEII